MSQARAAKLFRMSRVRYCGIEMGDEKATPEMLETLGGLPNPRMYERLYAYRRRLNLTQEEVAEHLGVCRYTYQKLERPGRPKTSRRALGRLQRDWVA